MLLWSGISCFKILKSMPPRHQSFIDFYRFTGGFKKNHKLTLYLKKVKINNLITLLGCFFLALKC